jgi:anti-sigma B factor antagonist
MSKIPSDKPTSGLRTEVSTQDGVAVVKCGGRLDLDSAPDLNTEARRLIPLSRRIVLDLGGVSFMDSSGLGTVVGLYASAKSANCELQLANPTQQILRLLSLTHLLPLFETPGQQL